jgi:hypothetical protein
VGPVPTLPLSPLPPPRLPPPPDNGGAVLSAFSTAQELRVVISGSSEWVQVVRERAQFLLSLHGPCPEPPTGIQEAAAGPAPPSTEGASTSAEALPSTTEGTPPVTAPAGGSGPEDLQSLLQFRQMLSGGLLDGPEHLESECDEPPLSPPPACIFCRTECVRVCVIVCCCCRDAVALTDFGLLGSGRCVSHGPGPSPSALVRDFCGNPANVQLPSLVQALHGRTSRARVRALGLECVLQTLLGSRSAPGVRTTCLHFFSSAMRACGLHPLGHLHGCAMPEHQRLQELMGSLVRLVVDIISVALEEEAKEARSHALSVAQPEPSTAAVRCHGFWW